MLGVFVAAVVFALVTLRLVTQESVPRITVTVAVALALRRDRPPGRRSSTICPPRSGWSRSSSRCTARPSAPSSASSARASAIGVPAPEGPTTDTVAADRPGRVTWIDDAALEGLALATGGDAGRHGRPGRFVAQGDVVLRQLGGRPLDPAERHRAQEVGAPRDPSDHGPGPGLRDAPARRHRAARPLARHQRPHHGSEAILRSADLLRRLARRPPVDHRVVREGRVILLRPRPPSRSCSAWRSIRSGARPRLRPTWPRC